MKKVIIFLSIVCFANMLFAQSDKYKAAMKKNIIMLDSAMAKGNAADLANNFERIGDVEKTQWLPYYYAAYCTILTSYNEKDNTKFDGIADKADALIVKAEALAAKENSEIYLLKAMAASTHMQVNPMARYMTYSQAINENLQKSKELDATNPRPYYFEGTQKFYTPEAFGGGKGPAKILFEKAIVLFDAFKPADELMPTWGKPAALYFLGMCK